MLSVSETVDIDAPLSDVFAYMDDPHNQAEITPSLSDVRNVEDRGDEGKRLDYTYTMAGVSLDGTLETTTYEPESRVVFDMVEGPLSGELTWEFAATDDGTRVTYSAAYELPSSVLEAVVRPFAERYNERELETTLQNLKTRFESE
ncbi:SRPBCC family protein [Halosegnis longus]|uniref:SRPBCC family protein n=1 Tax=Halosegnis longus TaxID=2216012 RepID=A0AAJ4R7K6_9EURY|nr:SRPBCC family protein [Halosegnis longus]RNJ25759.1 SRPBCC family protein [Salella cibi]